MKHKSTAQLLFSILCCFELLSNPTAYATSEEGQEELQVLRRHVVEAYGGTEAIKQFAAMPKRFRGKSIFAAFSVPKRITGPEQRE